MINVSAMGVIFPNLHDANLPELVGHRTMASLPFAGRYRMIDFCLSGMSRAGIKSIAVIAQKNYFSLMDHLGSGREWDLSGKRGGLVIFPPYASERGSALFTSRIGMLSSILEYMEGRREELVVMSDCDLAFNMDYKPLLATHKETGADVTMVYSQDEITEAMRRDNVTMAVNAEGRVNGLRINEYKKGVHNVSMNVFVMGREALVSLVREAAVRGEWSFTADYLAKNLKKKLVRGYEFKGYRAHISGMQSYFAESLRLADMGNLARLFPDGLPVYTKIRDEAPVRYAIGATVKHSLVADGCIVEGNIEHCVLFRGVRVRKGAALKNCVIMQSGDIGPGTEMENVITDKNVTVGEGQRLRGAASFPVFVAKGCTVF